jgi:hypothetical protein
MYSQLCASTYLHLSPPFSPSILHFFLQTMYLDTSHIFSHQKLIPYGHDPTFEFTEGLFLSGYLLLATYHLPFPLPPMTTTTTYHILLTIRRLRPDTRVINLSIATSFDLHVNKEKLLLGCEPIQWYYNIISDWPRGSSEGGRNLPNLKGSWQTLLF